MHLAVKAAGEPFVKMRAVQLFRPGDAGAEKVEGSGVVFYGVCEITLGHVRI